MTKKKKKQKHRNPLVIPAKTRKAGPMRPKKDKRKKSKKAVIDESSF